MSVIPVALIIAAVVLVSLFVARLRERRVRPPARGRAAIALPPSVTAPKRQLRRNVPHALYLYPHRDGGVVYVGISNEPEARDARRKRDFAAGDPRVAWLAASTGHMQIVQWYPDWYAAREAEDALIERLALEGHPVANDQGNPLKRRTRRAA